MRTRTPRQLEFLKKEKRKVRPKKQGFNPDRQYIESAVEEFLKRGGKITKVEVLPEGKEFRDWQAIYEFLNS